MKKYASLIVFGALFLSLPTALFAATNCDSQAKPALSCPPGYDMMCIPTGGDHWGCGQQNGGMINEVPMMNPGGAVAPAAPTAQAPQPSDEAAVPQPPPAKQAAPAAPRQPSETSSPVTAVETSATSPVDTDAPLEPIGADSQYRKFSAASVFLYASLVIVLVAFASWLRRWLEGLKKAGIGGGTKAEEKKPCARCGGKGTITEKFTKTVKCTHCKGSGQDPCHHCGGTGKMTMPNPAQSEEELENWPPCDFCGGSGRKRVGAGRDWGEANEAMAGGIGCCMCHGRKTESYTETREVPCPDCKK